MESPNIVKPWSFALLAITACFSIMPVAHSLVILLRQLQASTVIWSTAHFSFGLVGLFIIYQARHFRALTASVSGFVGGQLLWLGFFEFGFAFFARLFDIQPVLNDKGEVLLKPGLQLVEASLIFLLPLMLMLLINPSIRCNMFAWLRQKLRLRLVADEQIIPAPIGLQEDHYGSGAIKLKRHPQLARIAAMETLFIIWFIYGLSILCLDPRILGPTHWLSMLIYCGLMAWPIYLVYRAVKITKNDSAFRYAIAVGILLWSWIEMLASMNMIEEYYVKPLLYPAACIATALLSGLLILATVKLGRNSPV